MRIFLATFLFSLHGEVKSDATEEEKAWTQIFKRYIRGRVTLEIISRQKLLAYFISIIILGLNILKHVCHPF